MISSERPLLPVDASSSGADFGAATLLAPGSIEIGFVPDSSCTPSTTENNTDVAWYAKARRAIGRAGLAFSVFTGGAAVDILASTPAHADTTWGVYQVQNTGGEGLILHDGSPSGPTIEVMPDGTSLQVQCYETGPTIETSAGADPDWLQVVAPDGQVGEASDAYISTSWSASNTLADQGLGECGSDNSGNTDTSGNGSSSEQAFSEYNGQAAANWAIANAEGPQIYGADECTWFVSNALWAGGLPKSPNWTDQGSHDILHPLPGTKDAWVPQDLKDYIMSTYPDSTFSQLNFSDNSVPQAKPGDIIFYDWGDGHLDHATLVVDDAPGTEYPEVSEWGNVDKAGESYPSIKQGWTFSRVYNKWIQAAYPGAKAYLLDINTGLDGLQTTGDPNAYNNIG